MSDISAEEYRTLASMVYDRCGITIGPGKETMVSTRLAKRMRETGCTQVGDYLRLVDNDKQTGELVFLLDAISTNTTSFFREPKALYAVDDLVRDSLAKGTRRFRFWSAASSTGMEAYSLAMLLADNGATQHDCAILATDISTRALAVCQNAFYDHQAVAPVPEVMRKKYMTAEGNGMRVNQELRALLTVNRLNLSRPPYPMRGPFDAIFCRNVMIYFDNVVRQRLVSACVQLLRPGGLFLIGAAESLNTLNHPLKTVMPSVFRK